MSGRPHPPSQMRALLQDWKHGGRSVRELLPVARSIEDPSFAAEGLFALATDPKLDGKESEHACLEALRFADKVERDWRRGEALTEMARRLPDLRKNHPETGARIAQALVDRILGLPSKTRAEAMRAAAGHVDATEMPRLLARALASDEEPLETGKAILKAALDAGAAAAVLPAIRDCLDAEIRLRMMGAWASRMAATQPEESARVLGETLPNLAGLPDAAVRLDIVRAIVAACEAVDPLMVVHDWAAKQDPETSARILSALGARADRLGRNDLAGSWLREAQARSERIPDEKARTSVQRNVQEGLKRAGVVASDAASVVPAPQAKKTADHADHAETTRRLPSSSRHVMALYDAYEGGLGEVHLRAVARAAPLCDAFGLDLALVGFPIKDLPTFVKRAGRETNIGEGRGSLEALLKAGRLHLVAVAEGEVPDVSALGTPVATTPSPDPSKAASEFPTSGRLCVLVGLGPKGLPDGVLRACAVHVELTGKGVSLETATAMGVIAERMRRLLN